MKLKRATAFFSAFTLLACNTLTVSAETEQKTASNFGYTSQDEVDWNSIDFSQIPSSEKLNFGKDEETIWGENIIYPIDTSLEGVSITPINDDYTEFIYEWDIPATEVIYSGGSKLNNCPQQMVFGRRIEKAFYVTFRVWHNNVVNIKIEPNDELLENQGNVESYILPENANIKYNYNCFNRNQSLFHIFNSCFDNGTLIKPQYDESTSTVTYSFPRYISSSALSNDIYLNLYVNKNAVDYTNGNYLTIFGKTFGVYNGKPQSLLDFPYAVIKGKNYDCLIKNENIFDNSVSKNTVPKFYSVTTEINQSIPDVTFIFSPEQERIFKFQNYLYSNYKSPKKEIAELEKYLKDALTMELSVSSKTVADNIVCAISNEKPIIYEGKGYREAYSFNEENLTVEEYKQGEKTYYRIKYCPLNDAEIENYIYTTHTEEIMHDFVECNLTFTIPLKKLIGGDNDILVGVPYEFYDKNDYYNQSLTNSDYFLNVADIENTFRKNSLKGDVNVDGEVDYRDISLLRDYLLNKSSFAFSAEHFNVYGADINDDNSIDIFDMSLLRGLI